MGCPASGGLETVIPLKLLTCPCVSVIPAIRSIPVPVVVLSRFPSMENVKPVSHNPPTILAEVSL